MPKMKTKRGAAKRFRRTPRGKILRYRSYGGHLMTGKSPRRRRRLRQKARVSPVDEKRVKALLPYARRKR
ncbi:MAG: 50S ribosomal protein L35 [candidate division Zixibacteria bacterium]|nr:50S ribosomal protein L35 [candidate division Zixibacteria bacterium]